MSGQEDPKARLLEVHTVSGPFDEHVKVQHYSDGSIRFRVVGGSPMAITESFLSGHEKDVVLRVIPVNGTVEEATKSIARQALAKRLTELNKSSRVTTPFPMGSIEIIAFNIDEPNGLINFSARVACGVTNFSANGTLEYFVRGPGTVKPTWQFTREIFDHDLLRFLTDTSTAPKSDTIGTAKLALKVKLRDELATNPKIDVRSSSGPEVRYLRITSVGEINFPDLGSYPGVALEDGSRIRADNEWWSAVEPSHRTALYESIEKLKDVKKTKWSQKAGCLPIWRENAHGRCLEIRMPEHLNYDSWAKIFYDA